MKKRLYKAGTYFKENLLTNKSAGQTIMKNSFWLLLAEGTNKGILFLVTILIARNFSLEEYGVFGYVFSIMTLIAMIADFGLTNITIRELAKNRAEASKCFENAISLKILLSGIAFMFMIAAAAFLNPNIRILAVLAGLAILLEGMTDYLRTSFRMTEHTQFEVIIKAATAIMLIGLVISCIILKRSLTDILLGYITAHLFGLLLSLRLINRKLTFSMNTAFVGHLLSESWPLFLGLVCTAAYGQIDLILIKAYRGFAEVGLYQAAYKLLFGFQLLKVVHMAMFPRLATFHAEGNNIEYRRLMRTSIILSLIALIPVGIMTIFYSADVIRLFFGQQYVSAAIALPLLIWSGILSFIAGFFTYTLIIAGHQKSWLILEFLVLVILIIIEITLIPRIGFFGAAIATFAGEVIFLILIIAGVYSNRKLRVIFF